MDNLGAFLQSWDLHPSIIIGCLGLLIAEVAAVRWRLSRISIVFVAGVLVLAEALMSPLDALGHYLFSAHMLQHLLLFLLVAPLLIVGLPVDFVRRLLRVPWVAGVERFLRHPAVAWIIGIGTVAAWHLPGFYNAALASENVHIAQHLTFLVAATIFWWPLFSPLRECRIDVAAAVVYLLMAAFANGLIGAILMIVPPSFYPSYLHPVDTLHILDTLGVALPVSAAEDKRAGALFMIVGGATVIMLGAAYMLWIRHNDVQPSEATYTSVEDGSATPKPGGA